MRTENVRSRLRSGVIAEVGAGRPATVGRESIRLPEYLRDQAEDACSANRRGAARANARSRLDRRRRALVALPCGWPGSPPGPARRAGQQAAAQPTSAVAARAADRQPRLSLSPSTCRRCTRTCATSSAALEQRGVQGHLGGRPGSGPAAQHDPGVRPRARPSRRRTRPSSSTSPATACRSMPRT